MRAIINRYLLPGLAFKAVVIGGGYATGRELVEFFMPAGPIGGLWGMVTAMAIWMLVCVTTFLLAFKLGATDHDTFFRGLLGRFAPIFEVVYFAFLILVLSVFGSSAGAIGHAMLGLPVIAGTLALVAAVMAVCAFGQSAAEGLFKYVSVLLYGVYALFLVLSCWSFAPQIEAGLARPVPTTGWLTGGVTYASYNVIGAALILPTLRHLRSGRDAVVAGLVAAPLAMLPAIVFFICLVPFYPAILTESLPSDYALNAIGVPIFHYLFQLMVFFALLECSVGFVQAFNARVDVANAARGRVTPRALRVLVPTAIMFVAVFLAARIGLIALIGSGYRIMAWAVLAIYIMPLFTVGIVQIQRLCRHGGPPLDSRTRVSTPN